MRRALRSSAVVGFWSSSSMARSYGRLSARRHWRQDRIRTLLCSRFRAALGAGAAAARRRSAPLAPPDAAEACPASMASACGAVGSGADNGSTDTTSCLERERLARGPASAPRGFPPFSPFSSETGPALAPPSPSTTRLFFSVSTFSSHVMLRRGRATAETCPMLSPARASLHVINTPNNNNK